MAADGVLSGIRMLEFAGLGPAPFAGMMFADMGADILRIERADALDPGPQALDARGRRTLRLDLKDPAATALCLELCEKAEIIFEGFRPGVMERLGLGPDAMLARNPALVYGRMTGWGQKGPYASTAGHDINYLALTGALHAIGTTDQPVPPLNLAADYGGGAMFMTTGLLAALLHARSTGKGQIVDVAMTDGALYLMSMFYGLHGIGGWEDRREANLADGGAPFYNVYRCADDRWISVGAMEPHFYALLLEKLGATASLPQAQMDKAAWPAMRHAIAGIVATKTQAEWNAILEGTDTCFAPVLSLAEAPLHPHNIAREAFVEIDGIQQPAPAPRFSETPSRHRGSPAPIGAGAHEALADWGVSSAAFMLAGEG